MQAAKAQRKSVATAENAIAKKVLEEIEKIDAEAMQKKLAQLESLQQARENISARISELNDQIAQIDRAIEKITGKPIEIEKKAGVEKRKRRNLEEVRERVGRWMEGRKGQNFMAGDLVKEFPELDGVAVSIFMKPLVEAGKVKTDTSEGNRRTKYLVPEVQ